MVCQLQEHYSWLFISLRIWYVLIHFNNTNWHYSNELSIYWSFQGFTSAPCEIDIDIKVMRLEIYLQCLSYDSSSPWMNWEKHFNWLILRQQFTPINIMGRFSLRFWVSHQVMGINLLLCMMLKLKIYKLTLYLKTVCQ